MDRTQIPSTISPELLEELIGHLGHSSEPFSRELVTLLSEASGVSEKDFGARLAAKKKDLFDENANEYGVAGAITKG
jgi:hypothetical protein